MAARKPKVIPVEPVENCRECRCSKMIPGDGLYCRRYPPKLVYDASTGLNVARDVEVNPTHWCGEFSPHLSS